MQKLSLEGRRKVKGYVIYPTGEVRMWFRLLKTPCWGVLNGVAGTDARIAGFLIVGIPEAAVDVLKEGWRDSRESDL